MEPTLQRTMALLAAALLVAAPVLAQDGGDGQQDDQYDNSTYDNSSNTSDDSEYDGNASDGDSDQGEQADDRQDGENADEQSDEPRNLARDAPENARRDVSIVVDQARALFELNKAGEASEDRIKLDYRADDGRMKLGFERRADEAGDAGEEGSELDFEMDIQVQRVVEYRDVDGDGAYDPSVDETVSEFEVDDLPWNVTAAEEVELPDNKTGHRVASQAPLEGDGALEFAFTTAGDFAQVGATELSPRDVKVDFAVHDYPYEANDTQVALEVDVETETGYEVSHDAVGDTPAIEAMNGPVSGYFNWETWAHVDGEPTNVTAHVLEQETETEAEDGEASSKAETALTLSYERGEEIVHDPVMGVSYETASEDVSDVPAPGVAALAAAVGIAAAAGAVIRRD